MEEQTGFQEIRLSTPTGNSPAAALPGQRLKPYKTSANWDLSDLGGPVLKEVKIPAVELHLTPLGVVAADFFRDQSQD